VVVLATLFSLFAPDTIFNRVVFAWTALGASLVPMVLSKVFYWNVSARAALISIMSGFLLTIFFHLLPDTPGDIIERVVPMSTGLIVLFVSSRNNKRTSH